jgi:DNA-binding NtrC family response regulator
MERRLLAINGGSLVAPVVARLRADRSLHLDEADSSGDALRQVSMNSYQFILLDFEAHESDAIPFLKKLNRLTPLTDLIVLTERDRLEGVTVDQYIDKRLSQNEIGKLVSDVIAVRFLLDEAGIIGHSQNLKDAARRIKAVAPTDISVLISGPSGTGKELIARSLHANSPRRSNEFVSLNCASIPDTLLESELFGHEKGAFTGADNRREGLLEFAHKGTLFLDEIGEMHLRLQAKLLRAIDTKSFIPVGGRKTVTVDVRIIAATNRNLQHEVENGNFRADLYYRIGVITIGLIRLADRPEDILPLIAHYLGRLKKDLGFSPDATDLLLRYAWPGNVRELTNFLQRLLISDSSGEISRDTVASLLDKHGVDDRSLPVVTNINAEESGYRLIYQALLNLANEVMDMKRIINTRFQDSQVGSGAIEPIAHSAGDLEDMEAKLIRETLSRVGGNRKKASYLLGIGERTLYRKLKKYHLT